MFTPYLPSLAGGLIIGLSASLLLLTIGRYAGISSISWGALAAAGERSWRWLFLVGLVAGAFGYHALSGAPVPAPGADSWALIVVAGGLVGFGTRLGNGCTSGHGVCGLGRLSLRSLAAVLTFMGTGIATVYVLRHVVGAGA